MSRHDVTAARTRVVQDLARRVGEALADGRASMPDDDPGHDRDLQLARLAAASEMSRMRAVNVDGGDALDSAEEKSIIDEAVANVVGLGRLGSLMVDDAISDIHVRGCEAVWTRLRDGTRRCHPPVFDTDDELVAFVRKLAARNAAGERPFDPAHPEVNLQLPDGSRLFAAMGVSQRPMLVVRMHRFEDTDLSGLVSRSMMPPEVASFLAAAVRARRNIVIAGGTGTGKTTLLRALIDEVGSHERIVTIEDAHEIGLDRLADRHPDHDCLLARPANIEGHGEVTLADLARMALRMDPDRVIVGEVRGGEAFTMLLAMSQGNNGSMCTMHADSARSVFPKLTAYVSMASSGLPTESIAAIVGESVHFVVHIELVDGHRRVSEIREVTGADGQMVISNALYDVRRDGNGFFAMSPRSADLLAEHGFSLVRSPR
jgi:Flp pilus assembly CpaF family ATPase